MDSWGEDLRNIPEHSFNIPLVRPSPVYGQSIDNPYVNGPIYHNDMQHEIMEPNYLGLYNIPNGHQTNVGSAMMSSYSTLTNEDHHQIGNIPQASYEQEMTYNHFYNSINNTNNNVNSQEDTILTELISNNQEPVNMAPELVEMTSHHHAYGDLDRPSTSRGHMESSNDSLPSDRIRPGGEWMETCPEQMHSNGQDYGWMRPTYYSSAFGPSSSHDIPSTSSQQTPQKKHHMYGRRSFPYEDSGIDVNVFNEDLRNYSNINYGGYPGLPSAPDVFPTSSSSMIRTNEASCDTMSRSRTKNPKEKRCYFRENGKLSKDEKKAKENEIPLSMDDIVNLPIDEFNDRLAKHELSDTQLSLARDIRRRGKNKVAAQNCRKRKLDQIIGLQKEFEQLVNTKYELERDNKDLMDNLKRMKAIINKLNQYLNQNQSPKFNPNSYN